MDFLRGLITILVSDEDNYFFAMRTVRLKIKEQCVQTIQLCIHFLHVLRILIQTSHFESNIDICTRMDKTIYSSMKIQVNWLIIL